ncbi:MAG: glycosyltransferase family 9 protein [Paludibacteraceae bacterium]|nr:glycosyltransferase family 9 protein [Paludibacteraceae bacterium]
MRVLITCFSSISNVAAIVPQLYGLVNDYPEHEFIVLSRSFLNPLFNKLPRVTFVGADIRGKHRTIVGVYQLFKQLKAMKPDVVLDMQRSWRTKLIARLFTLFGTKTLQISFTRKEQKHLIKRGANKYHQIPTIFDRQARLYAKIKLKVNDDFHKLYEPSIEQITKIKELYGERNGHWIGIAPFSIARGKTLPLRKMKNIIAHFDKQPNTKIFLFGAGEMENELLSDWQSLYNNVYAVHTSLKLDDELVLMNCLDVMLCMDSANMHLASLMAVPVVSVWGATHPYSGFLGWKQSMDNCVGVDFSCRPCTAHSDKKCKYGDYRCLESLHSSKIIEVIEKVLKKTE